MQHKTKSTSEWGDKFANVTNQEAPPFSITVGGRELWALTQLANAGQKGCTPIDNPAP
ncbi:winged helix domain-containing protein, partial [Psychromarinibacter sediminicola]|uniref:winged helix domain-containing protein n=1 Tax=Psychromarinibacter sediminicola TaxID=3033385 RepID=UPI00403F087A